MKIICIGRNYLNHAEELNNDIPDQPMFFLKPDTAVLPKKNPLYYPDFTEDLHYEVEVLVKINKMGKNIEQKFASKYYDQIGLGIDFTARDIQRKAKEKGHPWELAKAFDNSAVVGHQFLEREALAEQLNFRLVKNGSTVQNGNTENMIFSIDQIIAYVSRFITLKVGDIIFTGTPAGVGPVAMGDELEGFIENEKMFDVTIK